LILYNLSQTIHFCFPRKPTFKIFPTFLPTCDYGSSVPLNCTAYCYYCAQRTVQRSSLYSFTGHAPCILQFTIKHFPPPLFPFVWHFFKNPKAPCPYLHPPPRISPPIPRATPSPRHPLSLRPTHPKVHEGPPPLAYRLFLFPFCPREPKSFPPPFLRGTPTNLFAVCRFFVLRPHICFLSKPPFVL